MNVVLINGSPHAKGNTAFALDEAAGVLEGQGIGIERIHVGRERIHGCVGCRACREARNRQCRFTGDPVNGWIRTMIEADGMVIGSPVYYAGINGTLKAFLDRAFYVAAANGFLFRHKVGAGAVAVRRAGSVAALDQIHKYFGISEMFQAGSSYWNMVYGMTPGEAARDAEGAQTMRVLAANMAWLLKIMEYGKDAVPPPAQTEKVVVNFIR